MRCLEILLEGEESMKREQGEKKVVKMFELLANLQTATDSDYHRERVYNPKF